MTDSTAETASHLATVAVMKSVISNIIDKHGPAVLDDRQRLLGLLRDNAPAEARGIRILMGVYDENVPQNFLASDTPLSAPALSQAVEKVVENTGLQPELAKWAVDVWAAALALRTSPAVPATAKAAVAPIPAAPSPALATIPSSTTATTAATETAAAEALQDAKVDATKPAPPSLPENDLVWDVSEPLAASPGQPRAAFSPAPSYVPAPSYAASEHQPAPTMPTPHVEVAAKSFFGKWKLSHVVTGVVCLAAIGYLRDHLSHSPAETTPVQSAPEPAPAVQFTVLSTDPDSTKWPVFDAGVAVKNVDKSFQFTFNIKHPNGHYYTYRPTVAFPDNARQGKGVMVAVDQAKNTEDMVSETAVTSVSRDIPAGSKTFAVNFVTSTWIKNPSAVPSICLSFSSGTQATKFEPDHAFLCASELKNNTCGISLGCGRLQ